MARPRDFNQLAKQILDISVGDEVDRESDRKRTTNETKRASGVKGGKSRAKVLTEAQRAEIARTAASARWKKKDD